MIILNTVALWDDSIVWDDNSTWDEGYSYSVEDGLNVHTTMAVVSGNYTEDNPVLESMFALLPVGQAWPPMKEDTVLKQFLLGISLSISTINNKADELLRDVFPDSPVFLEDWERTLNLPLLGEFKGKTVQDRIAIVNAMLSLSPYTNESFLEGIALPIRICD